MSFNEFCSIGDFPFQAGNMPEYYFENDFPSDAKLEELLSHAPKIDDASVVDAEDDVFANGQPGAVENDAQEGVDDADADGNVEKAIGEKDFDK